MSILLELEHSVPSTGRVNTRLTEMQDTNGLPFIYMQNQVHLIHIRYPNNLSITLKLCFSLKRLLRYIFKLLKQLVHLYQNSESLLPLFSLQS